MFDFADGGADGLHRGMTTLGEVDAFEAAVVSVVSTPEVAELFGLSEMVVQRLFRHPRVGGDLNVIDGAQDGPPDPEAIKAVMLRHGLTPAPLAVA